MGNSIEEDIKILQQVIKDYDNWNEMPYKFNQDIMRAIKNTIKALHKANKDKHNQSNLRRLNDRKYRKILSDYKRVLKENEELKNTNCLVKRYFKLKDTNTYLQKENEILKEEKDKQIERYQNMLATNDMLHVLECEKKDKIIDLMAKEILILDTKRAENIYDHVRIWETEKGIKQYYENKVKEIL